MQGDHTRYSTVVCCPTCGARFIAGGRDQAWSQLADHQAAAGCERSRR